MCTAPSDSMYPEVSPLTGETGLRRKRHVPIVLLDYIGTWLTPKKDKKKKNHKE